MHTFSSFADAAKWAAEEYLSSLPAEQREALFSYDRFAWLELSNRWAEVRVAGKDWSICYGPRFTPMCGTPGTYVMGQRLVEFNDETNNTTHIFAELAPDDGLPQGHHRILSIEAADAELRQAEAAKRNQLTLQQGMNDVVAYLQQEAARGQLGLAAAEAAGRLRGLLASVGLSQ